MPWRIECDKAAEQELDKPGPPDARRILEFLHDRIHQRKDPRSIGEALKGDGLGSFWKYRVGDYRVIASMEDEDLYMVVVRIGNRIDVSR